MKLLLLRHGQTQWNKEGRIQGWLDSPLTEQAKDELTALSLPTLNNPIIYSSDLGRAYESALIISKNINAEIIKDKRLRERCFGMLEGHVIDQDAQLNKPWSAYQNRYIHKIGEQYRIESEVVFEARIQSFIQSINNHHEDKEIIIVSHGEWLRAFNNIINGKLSWVSGGGILQNGFVSIVTIKG